jgi:hypothetical protein
VIGCESTPNYGTPERPVVGDLYEERSVHVGDTDTTIGLANQYGSPRLTAIVPKGAYPKGTKVTVRIVKVPKEHRDPLGLAGALRVYGLDRSVAIQILPASPDPASPIAFTLDMESTRQSWDVHVLHARETDSQWTVVNPNGALTPNGDRSQLRFTAGKSGLWNFAIPSIPPPLEGRLERVAYDCRPMETASTRSVTLWLSGNSYAWSRSEVDACMLAGSGKVTFDRYGYVTFDPGNHDDVPLRDFSLIVESGVITGAWIEVPGITECPLVYYVREKYVHVGGSQGTPIPAVTKTCTSFDGGIRDAAQE